MSYSRGNYLLDGGVIFRSTSLLLLMKFMPLFFISDRKGVVRRISPCIP